MASVGKININLKNHWFILQVESPLDSSPAPSNEEDDICSTLDYLDDACPRDRIYYLLETTQTHSRSTETKSVQDQGQGDSNRGGQGQGDSDREGQDHGERWFDLLVTLSEKYQLTRLKRIMRDVTPS